MDKLNLCENHLKVHADMMLTVYVCVNRNSRAWVVMVAYVYCLLGNGRAGERSSSRQFKARVSNQFRELYTYQQTR